MKTVYTVRGSSDGILGVYTTPKRAWAVAMGYGQGTKKQTYAEFRKFCRDNAQFTNAIFNIEEVEGDYNSVEITLFALNN